MVAFAKGCRRPSQNARCTMLGVLWAMLWAIYEQFGCPNSCRRFRIQLEKSKKVIEVWNFILENKANRGTWIQSAKMGCYWELTGKKWARDLWMSSSTMEKELVPIVVDGTALVTLVGIYEDVEFCRFCWMILGEPSQRGECHKGSIGEASIAHVFHMNHIIRRDLRWSLHRFW